MQWRFWKKSLRRRVAEELEEAEGALLTSKAHRESWDSACEMYEMRVERLSQKLRELAVASRHQRVLGEERPIEPVSADLARGLHPDTR